jgi:hypothetical protein
VEEKSQLKKPFHADTERETYELDILIAQKQRKVDEINKQKIKLVRNNQYVNNNPKVDPATKAQAMFSNLLTTSPVKHLPSSLKFNFANKEVVDYINKKKHELRTPNTSDSNASNQVREPRCIAPQNFNIEASDLTAPMRWHQWMDEWDNYASATRIDELSSNRQITYFLNAAGPKVLHIYNACKSPNDTILDVYCILKNHFVPHVTTSFHRIKLRQEKWLEEQTIDDFVNKLKTVSSMGCKYTINEEQQVFRDLIIEQCTDAKLTYNLLNLLTTNPDTTLQTSLMNQIETV